MIWIEAAIAVLLAGNILGGLLMFRVLKQHLWYLSTQIDNVTESQTSMRRHIDTTGRVLGVFEDELQVIQKRRERDQNLKTRFTRTPR